MRSNFEVKDAFLKNANHYVELDKGLYCASFIGTIIIGPVEFDDQSQLKFSAKSVIVPAFEFFQLVNVLHMGKNAYVEGCQESFQEILYDHPPSYQLMALFNQYDESWNFSLRYRWFFNKDRRYLQKVSVGLAEPIKTTDGQEFIFLPRGVRLAPHQVDLLWNQLHVLLQHTIFANDQTKQKVREFVAYVISNAELCTTMKNKLEDFKDLKFKDKAELLEEFFNAMAQERKMSPASFEAQTYLETLTNKMNLVYSLFNFHLKSSQ